MEYTTKWRLSKPTYDDDVDIQVLNHNFDIIDGKLNSVSVTDNTLHVDDNNYPLNFLPLTGGTVTGDVTITGDNKVTGTLTNNGKDVGKMFDGSGTIDVLLDWDKMKEVYGSTLKTEQVYVKGQLTTISFPDWCIINTGLGVPHFLATNKDLYLTQDFTNYDEIIFLTIQSTYFTDISRHKTKQLDYLLSNYGMINVTNSSGDLVIHGYYKTGKTLPASVSTKQKLSYYDDSCYIVNIFGVKYDN